MVVRYLILGLLFFSSLATASEVEINVAVDSEKAVESKPLMGIVTVSRTHDEKIDLDSFRCDGKELEVQFLHDAVESSLSVINGVRQEKKRLISTFRFLLPVAKAGKHQLPPITVKVGGHLYTSKPTAYIVYGTEMSTFLFRSFCCRGKSDYPGQKMQFTYRISCRKQIESCYEELPLMQADQFRKLGERKSICEFREGWVIQEIKQEVQAISPGEYHFEKSSIEGIPFQRDFFGNRIYEKTRLRAEAPQMTVVVEPFPEKDQPSTFQGALGSFHIDVKLITPPELVVGDKLRLLVIITGNGEWSTVTSPDLSSQSSFEGLFRISDLPPVVETGNNYKRFTIEMRPLSSSLTAIPTIEFSSFDPASQHYQTIHSQPIPLLVKAAGRCAYPIPETPHPRPRRPLFRPPLGKPFATSTLQHFNIE